MSDVQGAVFGGILIGSSALLMLLLLGRIAGVSGIVSALLDSPSNTRKWQMSFLIGMVSASLIANILFESQIQVAFNKPMFWYLIAGFLVGVGVRLGNGCTSGHGVCGIGRLSIRSIVATLCFMLSAICVATLLAYGG